MTFPRPLIAILAVLILSVPAQAKHTAAHNMRIDIAAIPAYPLRHTHYSQEGSRRVERHRVRHHAYRTVLASHRRSYGEGVIGGRPAGCPHAYCGCGLRKFLGLSDVRLNLAWNWALLFPRETIPRAGLAVVRHGHVMYIESVLSDGRFLIRDYNSGGGLSRLHIRDVRGYVFVNPHQRLVSQ